MIINIVVAITGNGGIGLKGGLPWPHLKTDMALFSKRTTGGGRNAVLMGKNTWFSIPENRRPLKNRTNIVISRNQIELNSCDGSCHLFSSTRDAISHCEECGEYDEVWIIGGSGIYNEFLNTHYRNVHRIYITYVCGGNYECDTFINIPPDSYFIEEKTYNLKEKCYYLTCIHKLHFIDNNDNDNVDEVERLEDFIKSRNNNGYDEHEHA
jgi:dihydrofolate reductase